MAIKITKKTKLINEFKLPRKKKKAFKKAWIGAISSITLKPSATDINPRAVAHDWVYMMHIHYHMKKFNLKKYKGTEEIFTTKGK
jgi:hypothetical protein